MLKACVLVLISAAFKGLIIWSRGGTRQDLKQDIMH